MVKDWQFVEPPHKNRNPHTARKGAPNQPDYPDVPEDYVVIERSKSRGTPDPRIADAAFQAAWAAKDRLAAGGLEIDDEASAEWICKEATLVAWAYGEQDQLINEFGAREEGTDIIVSVSEVEVAVDQHVQELTATWPRYPTDDPAEALGGTGNPVTLQVAKDSKMLLAGSPPLVRDALFARQSTKPDPRAYNYLPHLQQQILAQAREQDNVLVLGLSGGEGIVVGQVEVTRDIAETLNAIGQLLDEKDRAAFVKAVEEQFSLDAANKSTLTDGLFPPKVLGTP